MSVSARRGRSGRSVMRLLNRALVKRREALRRQQEEAEWRRQQAASFERERQRREAEEKRGYLAKFGARSIHASRVLWLVGCSRSLVMSQSESRS